MIKIMMIFTMLISLMACNNSVVDKAIAVNNVELNDECTAEKPIDARLDSHFKEYSNFKLDLNTYDVTESAVFYKNMHIEVTHGGCSHFAYIFKYVIDDVHAVTNKSYYLNKAIDLLNLTKMKVGYEDIPKEIAKYLKENINNLKILHEETIVVAMGYRHIYFSFSRAADNKVHIVLTDDTAL